MKVMTTGDGGMIYCEHRPHADMLRLKLYLGMGTVSGLASSRDRWWEFESIGGRRAIMNDIAAGIGLEQLKKLPAFVDRRREIAREYNISLDGLFRIPFNPDLDVDDPDFNPYYFYWIQAERRDELARHLRDNGVYTTFRYHPLHRVFKTGQTLPGADYAADHTLLLPLHQGLTDDDVQFVIDKVKEFYR
jgi:dTDP-4-amino-4,6-dideoxygalactose transaminase